MPKSKINKKKPPKGREDYMYSSDEDLIIIPPKSKQNTDN